MHPLFLHICYYFRIFDDSKQSEKKHHMSVHPAFNAFTMLMKLSY